MAKYKFDVIEALREVGYNTSRIRQEKFLAEATLQKLDRARRSQLITLIGYVSYPIASPATCSNTFRTGERIKC